MRRTLAVAAFCVVLASCEWVSGESSTIQIGTSEDFAIVFPMTVDPSDHNPPAEYSSPVLWDGEDHSWQCYDPELARELGRDLGPQVVAPLQVPVVVTEGDALIISYELKVTDSKNAAEPLCFAHPAFAPRQSSPTSLTQNPSICRAAISVDGVDRSDSIDPAATTRVVVAGLSAGAHVVGVASFACAGVQFGTGNQSLTVEVVDVSASGSSDDPNVTTVPTPLPYPTVRPTTTTTSPQVFQCPLVPEDEAARQDIAMVFWRLAGEPTGNPPHGFIDVLNAAYDEPISWLVDQGITTGVSGNEFAPLDAATPAEYMVFLHRRFGGVSPTGSPAHLFTDVSNSSYYADAVQWAFETAPLEDWSNGDSAFTFGPSDAMPHSRAADWFSYLGESFDYYACPVS